MEKREELEIPIIEFTPVMLSIAAASTCTEVDPNNTESAVAGRTNTLVAEN